MKEFYVRLRLFRCISKMTQQELAAKSGLHVNYINGLELEKRNPSLKVILKLAEAFDISAREFFE